MIKNCLKRSRFLILLCFIQLVTIAVPSLHAQKRIKSYAIKEGLSSNLVYALEMDHNGYLWIGTYHGLNRFDGQKIKQYYFGELSRRKTDQVSGIYSDSKDRLWVSTFGNLYLYNDENDEFVPISDHSINIGEITEDPEGTIWAVGYDVFIVDESSLSLTEITLIGENVRKIEDILFDRKGNIWLGTYMNGVYQCRYDGIKEPDKLYVKKVFSQENSEKMKSNIVRELMIDDNEKLWFTTYEGLNWIDLDDENQNLTVSGFTNELSEARFWSVIQDKQGDIWAGTFGDGLYRINAEEGSITSSIKTDLNRSESLSCNEVTSIFADKYQNIWIGTENGMNKIVKDEIEYTTYLNIPGNPYSILSNHVYEIYQDTSSKVWIGTPKGISMLDYKQKNGKFKKYDMSTSGIWEKYIVSITPGYKKNEFFVGAAGGLFVYELDGHAYKIEGIKHLSRSVVTIQDIIKVDSILWIASDGGIYAYDYSNKEIVSYHDFGQQPLDCRKILYSKDKSLWFATDNGLKRLLDPQRGFEENNIINYPLRIKNTSNFNIDITDVIEDKDLDKWTGTGSGLYHYHASAKQYLEFNIKNGLLEDYVSGLLEYKEKIIAIGLSSISLIHKKNHEIESYSFNTVISNKKEPFYITALNDGNIAVGGINGLKILNPENFKKESTHYPLIVEDFKIGNKSFKPAINRKMDQFKRISATEKIYLDGKSNTFKIEFSSLNLSESDRITYRYKLDDYDNDWMYVNKHQEFANYSKLNAGTYVFRVNATNSIGQWNEEDTVLEIVVLPPIWLRWYSILVYIILLIVLLIVVKNELSIRYKLSTEKKVSREIKKRNEEQLKFFINISHEIKTPLSLIKGPVEYLNKKLNSKDELFKYSEWALKSVHKLTSIVNEILDFRLLDAEKLKPSYASVNWKNFIETTFNHFQQVATQKNIKYNLLNSIDQVVLFDASMIEKAFVSMLDNAFKYSPENSEISILTSLEKNYFKDNKDGVHIVCSNTGSYIPPEDVDNVFGRFYRTKNTLEGGSGIGLSITKQFVELHKGEIWCVSQKDTGVEFHVVIPMLVDARNENGEKEYITENSYHKIYGEEPVNESYMGFSQEQSNITKPKILIVEDEISLRNFMVSILQEHYHVLPASNGKEAIKIVEETIHPDLIISDIMMPEMDGFTLCDVIKGNDCTSHIPIVLLTAWPEKYSQLDSYKHEANAYIEKPFTIEMLNYCIKSILRQTEAMKKCYSSILVDFSKNTEDTDYNKKFIDRAKQIVLKNIDNANLGIETICNEMSISQYMLYNKMKSITGKTPGQIIKTIRIHNAEELLKKNQYSIKEIQYMTGFNTPKSFRDAFKEKFGVLPSEYVI
jgi:signal transduction histidine kinase/ligand-binding sensor domain-containing protein/DNA-binding response OmpR family regulator